MTAISEYFRTALVIDDRVEGDYSPLEELSADETVDLSGEPQPGLAPPPADDETPVHASALVSAFIDQGIVCGVLQPDENESDLVALACRGAQIADLLILDWLLFGDGTKTIDMISAVTDVNKGRLTVVVIFTGVPKAERHRRPPHGGDGLRGDLRLRPAMREHGRARLREAGNHLGRRRGS